MTKEEYEAMLEADYKNHTVDLKPIYKDEHVWKGEE